MKIMQMILYWTIGINVLMFAEEFELKTRPNLVTKEAELSVEKGLKYLASEQNQDGSWRSNGRYGGYPCSMTALAGLAFLASGNTPLEGPYSTNVYKAVNFILSCETPSGLISSVNEEQRSMYGHGFSMLFLGQVYGLGVDDQTQKRIKRVLTKAVKLTGMSQSSNGGWLYEPDSMGDEGSVTVTQIQGLRSIKNSGIDVPKKIILDACAYIEKCANSDGGIAYSLNSRVGSRPAITAAAVATLYNAGVYDNPVALKAMEYIMRKYDFDSGHLQDGHDSYTMLYLSQAMYLSGEENWKKYFPIIQERLVKSQNSDGKWNGDHVGSVYGTSIALVTLYLPYKFLPIMQR